MLLLYVTHKNKTEAKKIVDYLLKQKLIACANYIPIESSYWWKGKIENSNEIVTLLKTKEENFEKLKQEIKKIHPYDVPCIIKLNAEANKDYEEWINNVT